MGSDKIGPEKSRRSPTRRKASGFIVGNNQRSATSQFGRAVRARREQLGITQTELAKLAGLNRSYLSELERGLVSISLERAEKLAKALNCTLRDLLR
jgi:DNA-binding XRE family transcriptional regulator